MNFTTDFDGNFCELASLMRAAWSGNREQPLRYSSAFLRSVFQYPGSTLQLAPAIYRNGRLVGFFAGFPRAVRWQGRDLRILLNTFLSVSPDYQAAGFGFHLWKELSRRARGSGFDGMIDFCVEGDKMNQMILAIGERSGVPIARVFKVGYLGHLMHPIMSAPS